MSRLLDTESIIQSAEIASGTAGLIDHGLRGRVDALAGWFRDQPQTDDAQAEAARRQIVRILARRLGITADIARNPQILEEAIEDPIFIVGFPRTGTSLLQSLLAADPTNRTPRAWQVREPSPPPGERPVTAYRLARAAADVTGFVDRCPGLLTLHPYWDDGATTAIEDEEIFTLDFQNAYPSLLYDASSLAMMVSITDAGGAYAFLKTFMQHQQWRLPRRRWVMKGVEHQRQLPALFRAFPNARCIWAHREPGEFLPSNLAIASVVYDGITNGALDRKTLASGFLAGFAAEIARIMADGAIDDARILHVTFRDLVRDPVTSLRTAHEKWGTPLGEDSAANMQAWLDDPGNAGDRYGKHRYDFQAFGVDWPALSPAFQGYRNRFLTPASSHA